MYISDDFKMIQIHIYCYYIFNIFYCTYIIFQIIFFFVYEVTLFYIY